jgi:hypothetical protein
MSRDMHVLVFAFAVCVVAWRHNDRVDALEKAETARAAAEARQKEPALEHRLTRVERQIIILQPVIDAIHGDAESVPEPAADPKGVEL